MRDPWRQYKDGLDRLLKELSHDHSSYTEVLVLQQRLLENLARARLYGDTETGRAERAQLLSALDRLALEGVGRTFSALFPEIFGRFIREADGAITFIDSEPVIIGDSDLAKQVLETTRETSEEVRDDYRQVIEIYEHNITTAREQGNRQAEAIYLQDLGLAQFRLADIEQDRRQDHLTRAADVLRRAVELLDVLKAAPLLRARARYHLGRCYHQLNRWREAIASLEQARETFSRCKACPELAHTLLELGQLYYRRQDFESSYIYLKDALRLFRRLKDINGIAVTQEALGSLALQTARMPEALSSLREARQGYATLQRSERVQAVDDLLHIAHQARQPLGGTTL